MLLRNPTLNKNAAHAKNEGILSLAALFCSIHVLNILRSHWTAEIDLVGKLDQGVAMKLA